MIATKSSIRLAASAQSESLIKDNAPIALGNSTVQAPSYELYELPGRVDGSRQLVEAKVCGLESKPVDAIILEYPLGLFDSAPVADEIKRVGPRLPIVMLAEGGSCPRML